MSNGLPCRSSSPFRHSDEDLLHHDDNAAAADDYDYDDYDDDGDDDDDGIPNEILHESELWKDQEMAGLRGESNANQDDKLQISAQNHRESSSTASTKHEAELNWSWPNAGYLSLKQWASSNNMSSFTMNNVSPKDVTKNDTLSSSCTRSSPEDSDLAWINNGRSGSKNDKSFAHFGNESYMKANGQSSLGGRKKCRSLERTSVEFGGLPPQGPQDGDVVWSVKSAAAEDGFKNIKEENTEINDNEHLSCHVCNFVGVKEEDFREHMSIHFRHRCTLCDYTCRTAGRLRRHTKEYHHEEHSPTSASASTATTAAATTIGDRAAPASSNVGAFRDAGLRKNYSCRHCNYSTVERDNYWEHKLVHIPLARQLRCPYVCKFVTDLKHHLVYHLLNHSGTKPYHCDRCSYDCINKSMLNSHMKSHSNYYPYRCFHCSFASKYPHPMKVHERKRGHKRIQLNPGAAKKAPPNCATDFKIETPLAKHEFKASEVGTLELTSPIKISRAPSKKRRNRKGIECSLQFQSQQSQSQISSNKPLQNFPQFPMAFAPTGGGYFFPGFLPTNAWMFPSFASRLPFGGVLPQMNAAAVINEPWFARKALTSNEEQSQSSKSNFLAAATYSTKSVGCGNNFGNNFGQYSGNNFDNNPNRFSSSNSSQINLLQSMNLFQSNVMFNFSQYYAGGGDPMGGPTLTQTLKCSICYFVANTAVGLLQHTMLEHTAASATNTHPNLKDFFETTGRPLSQSTPMKHPKLLEDESKMTNSKKSSAAGANGKPATSTRERYDESNAMNPQAEAFASFTCAKREAYDQILTSEITASIERERKKRDERANGGDSKRNGNYGECSASTRYPFKLECASNREIEGHKGDVSNLSARSQSRLSNASIPDDIGTASYYTPLKQLSDSAGKLDLIGARLQSRHPDSGSSSQGYHTSNLSGSSTKEISASSGASWPIGSPVSPRDISSTNEVRWGNGGLRPAHSAGAKPKELSGDNGEEKPEDLSLVGRERVKDQNQTPSGSSACSLSAIRCLNEQFGVRRVSTEEGVKCQTLKSLTPHRLSPPPSTLGRDVRVGPYPHECRHCKLMFSEYSMYAVHMAYHGRGDPFECNRCGKFSENEVDFFNHIGTAEH